MQCKAQRATDGVEHDTVRVASAHWQAVQRRTTLALENLIQAAELFRKDVAIAGHGKAKNALPPDRGDAGALLAEFVRAAVDHAVCDIGQCKGVCSFA